MNLKSIRYCLIKQQKKELSNTNYRLSHCEYSSEHWVETKWILRQLRISSMNLLLCENGNRHGMNKWLFVVHNKICHGFKIYLILDVERLYCNNVKTMENKRILQKKKWKILKLTMRNVNSVEVTPEVMMSWISHESFIEPFCNGQGLYDGHKK